MNLGQRLVLRFPDEDEDEDGSRERDGGKEVERAVDANVVVEDEEHFGRHELGRPQDDG